MSSNFVSGGSLAATAWSGERIDLVTLNGDGGPMYHLSWDGPNGWQQGWDSRGGQFKASDPPSILNFGQGTLFLLGVDSGSGHVTSMRYTSSGWSSWDADSMSISGLGAAVWDASSPSVFAYGVGGSGQLVSHGWSGQWLGSPIIGGGNSGPQPTLASNLVVSSWGPQDNDIFGLDSQGAMWHLGRISSGFGTSWDRLGGKFSSIPSAVSWGENRIDLFVTGEDAKLQHQYWNGTTWASDWESLGGTLNSPPSAVSWGNGRLDIFALATDGSLQHLSYDASSYGWQSAWDNLGGGPFSSPPVALAREENILDVFVAAGCTVSHLPWQGTSWAPWEDHGCPTGSSSAPQSAAPTIQDAPPTIQSAAPGTAMSSAAGTGGPSPEAATSRATSNAPTVLTTTIGSNGNKQSVSQCRDCDGCGTLVGWIGCNCPLSVRKP